MNLSCGVASVLRNFCISLPVEFLSRDVIQNKLKGCLMKDDVYWYIPSDQGLLISLEGAGECLHCTKLLEGVENSRDRLHVQSNLNHHLTSLQSTQLSFRSLLLVLFGQMGSIKWIFILAVLMFKCSVLKWIGCSISEGPGGMDWYWKRWCDSYLRRNRLRFSWCNTWSYERSHTQRNIWNDNCNV